MKAGTARPRGEFRSWALFAPVAFGIGVAAYFQLSVEPSWRVGAMAATVAAAAFLLALPLGRFFALRAVVIGCGLASLGFGVAQLRAWSVAAPVWEGRGEVRLSGRAIALEQTRHGAPRLLIDRVAIVGVAPENTPARVRVSFRALADSKTSAPLAVSAAREKLRAMMGRKITMEARLFAPPGPAEPGAFDYRRRAWFEQVGALGSATRLPLDAGAAVPSGVLDAAHMHIDAIRRAIAARARIASPGPSGEIAAALLVGDRSAVPVAALADLRAANLAHLLAISGLHMGIICATAFGALRMLFALWPSPPFQIAPKKLAAVAALLVGGVYLVLAGGAVATQRAFIMAAVIFAAVLADRPAVTLRAVAAAAMIILVLRPESLFDPGFQLSFAATTAMVATFEAAAPLIRRRRRRLDSAGPLHGLAARIGAGIAGLGVASGVAGLATAPFAAAAFNRLAPLGLAANLLAVPALGLWIMPLGLAAAPLALVGLDGAALRLMGWGIDYVLMVAHWIAASPWAIAPVKAAPPYAIWLIAGGGLCLCLWRARMLKALGLAPLAIGLGLWSGAERPTVLIADGGRRLGVMTAEGRAFDRKAEGNYAAELWARRDGEQPQRAHHRAGFVRFKRGAVARTAGGLRVELNWDRRPKPAELCAGAGIIVTPRGAAGRSPRSDCMIFDRPRLAEIGSIAVYAVGQKVKRLETAAGRSGARLWTNAKIRRAALGAAAKTP
ncbi:MAG: ComEC family competence protein [Neomegalonema sp.]|nr:ComEC family competence protein [Neomegalonema sp.]